MRHGGTLEGGATRLTQASQVERCRSIVSAAVKILDGTGAINRKRILATGGALLCSGSGSGSVDWEFGTRIERVFADALELLSFSRCVLARFAILFLETGPASRKTRRGAAGAGALSAFTVH